MQTPEHVAAVEALIDRLAGAAVERAAPASYHRRRAREDAQRQRDQELARARAAQAEHLDSIAAPGANPPPRRPAADRWPRHVRRGV